MRDLGYQGLLVVTFFGVAVAGLIYAKMIEPILLNPPVRIQYWNFKNVKTKNELDIKINENAIQHINNNLNLENL